MSELPDLLMECGAVQFGDFVLTSGRRSRYYVDVKKASTRPEILEKIAEEMAAFVGEEERLAGMELGAVPIMVALALRTKRPYLILRKGKREHGTGKRIEGEFNSGESILIIEDVATTGGSIVRSAEILRSAGLIVKRALVVVDREEGAAEALEREGIELIPVVRVSELRRK